MVTIQLSKKLRRRGRQVENASSRIVRQMGKSCLKGLVYNTKVDTGTARSNWRVSINAPTRSVISPYSPYPKGSKANGAGSSETANAAATIAAGYATINQLRGISGVGLKSALYITNSIDYLDKAMMGGGVETAIRMAQASIRNFRIFTPGEDDSEGDL